MHQMQIGNKKTVLDALMAEGYIEFGIVDPILLTTLLEDLLIMPGSVEGRRILLPGPIFGLKRVPMYVFMSGKKPLCMKLSEVIDKKSSSAAQNLILFQVFNEIEKAGQLISDEKHDIAYELISAIENKMLQARIYFSNDFKDIDNKITTLKRKIEIEKNIFAMT